MRVKVFWKETIICWATVEAESKEAAIEMAKRGEYSDTDSEPCDKIGGSYMAEFDR